MVDTLFNSVSELPNCFLNHKENVHRNYKKGKYHKNVFFTIAQKLIGLYILIFTFMIHIFFISSETTKLSSMYVSSQYLS